ncbi:Zinc transporter SLC39A7 [Aphelenchoides bicaudatus]|nr:Zinc transporter SLC39A7 [Aphelenchoides bicaudatus]
MLPGFTNEQTENLLIGLAKIHGVSMLNRNWHSTMSAVIDQMPRFIASSRTVAQELREIKPEWFNELLDELECIYTLEYYHDTSYSGTKFGIPACIVHADLWSANVLWRRDKNGKATSKLDAIIDWQMIYSGNPAADIARALCFNTSSKYRYENEDRLLKLYYDAVNQTMSGKIPFSVDQLKQAYIASFPYVASVASFGAPMYYRMTSIVGDPLNPELQHELLDRVYNFFKDTVKIIRAENKSKPHD